MELIFLFLSSVVMKPWRRRPCLYPQGPTSLVDNNKLFARKGMMIMMEKVMVAMVRMEVSNLHNFQKTIKIELMRKERKK